MRMRRSIVLSFLLMLSCKQASAPPQVQPTRTTERVAEQPAAPVVPAEPVAPVVPDVPKESALDIINKAVSLDEAVIISRSLMSDAVNDASPGMLLLSLWAATHLKWSEVSVKTNETSFALVRKDSDSARGKRMCYRGAIIEIRKEKEVPAGELYSGKVMTVQGDVLSFVAAGSTGELVSMSEARFCGVVIGTYDYSNSRGGTSHAVAVVGMFDLPENRVVPATP